MQIYMKTLVMIDDDSKDASSSGALPSGTSAHIKCFKTTNLQNLAAIYIMNDQERQMPRMQIHL